MQERQWVMYTRVVVLGHQFFPCGGFLLSDIGRLHSLTQVLLKAADSVSPPGKEL